MDWLLRSQHAARQFDGAVGDDLVDVHVGLRTAAGLPDTQGKLLVEFAGDDLVGSLNNQSGLFRRQLAQILVHQRARLLEDAEGADQFRRHGVTADVEMQKRALGLRAPVEARWDLDLSHAVGFNASLRGLVVEGCHSLTEDYNKQNCPLSACVAVLVCSYPVFSCPPAIAHYLCPITTLKNVGGRGRNSLLRKPA